MLARMKRLSSFAWVVVLVLAALPSALAQDAPPPEAAEPVPAPEPVPEPAVPPASAPPATQAPPADAAPPPPPPPERDGDYGGRDPSPSSEPAHRSSNDDDYDDDRDDRDDDYEPEPDDSGGDDPPREFSIRLDPFNWLIAGRLGIELEMTAWKFITVEIVPILVANDDPPAIDFGGFDDALTQHSNGIGPFSGASFGAGFWLQGEPFSGYVLRFLFTNYGYTYRARDGAGVFDHVSFTERRFVGFFGSHSRFGPFTLAGGFGLGYELNQQQRCGLTTVTPAGGGAPVIAGRDTNCNDRQAIALQRDLSELADLNGSLHPVYLEARFSLGFVF